MERRPVWVRGVLPLPIPPPGIARPNDPYEAKWWPGLIVAWRWTDKKHAEWTALVSYQRPNGLQYLHEGAGPLLTERIEAGVQ
jgi:hypothetical protein